VNLSKEIELDLQKGVLLDNQGKSIHVKAEDLGVQCPVTQTIIIFERSPTHEFTRFDITISR